MSHRAEKTVRDIISEPHRAEKNVQDISEPHPAEKNVQDMIMEPHPAEKNVQDISEPHPAEKNVQDIIMEPHPAEKNVQDISEPHGAKKNVQDIISELADLIEEKRDRVAGMVVCIMDNKMCLHCSRAYLREWLSEKDLVAYDQVFRRQHWCKCED